MPNKLESINVQEFCNIEQIDNLSKNFNEIFCLNDFYEKFKCAGILIL